MDSASLWQTLLANENWTSIPATWLDNRPGPAALLFRTHRHLQSRQNLGDYQTDQPIVHAAPRPLIGTSANRLNSQKFYVGAPYPFNFVTVYRASPGQTFYPDETLELVRRGKMEECGAPLEAIEAFDPVKHFETDVSDNTPVGTYLVLLPRDPRSAFSVSVETAQVKILPVDERVAGLLQSLDKTAPAAPEPARSPTI